MQSTEATRKIRHLGTESEYQLPLNVQHSQAISQGMNGAYGVNDLANILGVEHSKEAGLDKEPSLPGESLERSGPKM